MSKQSVILMFLNQLNKVYLLCQVEFTNNS